MRCTNAVTGLLCLLTLLVRPSQSLSCYFPNGKTVTDSGNSGKSTVNSFYHTCPTSFGNDGFHMCCKIGSPFDDVCTQDGLCTRMNDSSLALEQGTLRSTCTDQSWSSPSCLHLCTTGIDYLGNEANGSEQFVKQCDDGSWWCEAEDPPLNNKNELNNTMLSQVNAFCDQGKGMFIRNGEVTNVNPNATATSSSTAAVATPSSSSPTPPVSSPSSSPSATPQPNVNAGVLAGGTVGGIGGLFIIIVVVFVGLGPRRKPTAKVASSAPTPIVEKKAVHEMRGEERPYEKQGNERFEKDGIQLGKGRGGPYEIGT